MGHFRRDKVEQPNLKVAVQLSNANLCAIVMDPPAISALPGPISLPPVSTPAPPPPLPPPAPLSPDLPAPPPPTDTPTPPPTPSERSQPESPKRTIKHHLWEATKTILRLVKESADAYPPLKSTAGGLVALIDLFEVYIRSL